MSADTLGKHFNQKSKIFCMTRGCKLQIKQRWCIGVCPFDEINTTDSSHSSQSSFKMHRRHVHPVSRRQIVNLIEGPSEWRSRQKKGPNDWNIDSTTERVQLTPSCHLVTMSSRAPTSHPDPPDLYSGTWRSMLAASAARQLLFLWQN